jgi:UDP-N-acetylmuramate--alanine ligase
LEQIKSLDKIDNFFFIGVAGVGMSALAQYLVGIGKHVSGSDRYFAKDSFNETQEKLEAEGIICFPQGAGGVTDKIELVIVSTAIEDTVPEVHAAKQLGIQIIMRSDLLALIAATKKTIAVGGTSGKSTTGGMLFQILETAGLAPGIISGAGLVSIIKEGKIGNAKVGKGEWLVIEADESDGSIVKYHPEIGLLLNIDKDHQEIDELLDIFATFRKNTTGNFVVNRSNKLSATLSNNIKNDFSSNENEAGFVAKNLTQEGMNIRFTINDVPFHLKTIGKHNMENALAATAVASIIGVSLENCAKGLAVYEGIYRRHQLLGEKNGIKVIDDYAHNPAKCAASIMACQPIAQKVIAWFQPHGYGPTRFLRNDFIQEITAALRPQDEIWMSEIFYAGGTAVKDISANDLINDIKALGKNAFFVEDRNNLLDEMRPHITDDCVLLLMGARDPGLEEFCKNLYEQL